MAHSKLSRCVLSRRAALITSPLFCSRSRTSRTRPGRLRFLDEDRCRLSIACLFAVPAHHGVVDHIVLVLT